MAIFCGNYFWGCSIFFLAGMYSGSHLHMPSKLNEEFLSPPVK